MSASYSPEAQHVARELKLDVAQVQPAIALLDEGNTVAFMTRYRRDQTRGLDEEQIRSVKQAIEKTRALVERKSTVLKSIQAQGKLDEALKSQIEQARSIKRLEDLYLPYKPKKQTLATTARQRGLEPLAQDVLEGKQGAAELAESAQQYVRVDRELPTVDDVFQGVGHLIAELFSEDAGFRSDLRRSFWKSGRIKTTGIPKEQPESSHSDDSAEAEAVTSTEEAVAAAEPESVTSEPLAASKSAPVEGPETSSDDSSEATSTGDAVSEDTVTEDNAPPSADSGEPAAEDQAVEDPAAEKASSENDVSEKVAETEATNVNGEGERATASPEVAAAKKPAKKKKRKKKAKKIEEAFSDYFDFQEMISQLPPHRVLAINRGEKAKAIRVRMEFDEETPFESARKRLIEDEHPQAELLTQYLRDAMTRLLVPSLEREIRRELTERAESHAVEVFAQNLRNLLLQRPVNGHRVLAVDPGYKSGCKVAVLDEMGQLVESSVVFVVGNEERRKKGREWLVGVVEKYQSTVVAIGNGTASRAAEELIASVLSEELAGRGIAYVIVNEAGASIYSTSEAGREELPEIDPTVRSAISIGRRLLDPLSELVKISPENLGVGLYQHDVKAKHLRESLDEVVESCVNYVGVDANTASPALLKYVSGLNQLSARRFVEYRKEHGPFTSREQFRNVAGFGEATFVQAAGFLKIAQPENPLDATWIHPESYDLAEQILTKLDGSTSMLQAMCSVSEPENEPKQETPSASETLQPRSELQSRIEQADIVQLASDLEQGELLVRDLVSMLVKPGRDPRESFAPPVFRTGATKIEDLEPGMELPGRVLNVVDFGVFVDIGLSESGLVHISRLARGFVKDPHQSFAVGQAIQVWVVEVDKQRRRVSLTAIDPAQPAEPRREKKRPSGDRPRGKQPRRGRRDAVQGRGAKRGRTGGKPAERRARPKAPVKPLNPEVAEGKAPMRSFTELVQFMEHKKTDDK